jgi:hypothetical protein
MFLRYPDSSAGRGSVHRLAVVVTCATRFDKGMQGDPGDRSTINEHSESPTVNLKGYLQ